MKLREFMQITGKRKKLIAIVILVSFVLMLLYTILFNKVEYEINASIKLDANILLSANAVVTTTDKNYSKSDLKLEKLDDQSAMQYVQNNKSFYDDTSMIDYQQVITRMSERDYIKSLINSYAFKSYLVDNNIIENSSEFSVVEQTDTLSLAFMSNSRDKTQEMYNKVIVAIPKYVGAETTKKLSEVNIALNESVKKEKEQADKVIEQYSKLKKDTGFADVISLNSGIEMLNMLSYHSHNINKNLSVSNKIESLMTNQLNADLILKSVNTSGLNYAKTLISYMIIEFIASVLLSLVVVFLVECGKGAKASK